MGLPVNNSFTSYELSIEEQLVAYKFNELQLQALQNEVALLAEERINLRFDPSKPIEFAQLEAEISGKILLLQYLIERSNSTPTM